MSIMDETPDCNTPNVHAFPAPNPGVMREHLEHLFCGFPEFEDGLIELAWTDAGGAPKSAELFSLDQLDDLINKAHSLNLINNCNVYIGAALKHPDTCPFTRTVDSDFYVLTCAYADMDDPGAALGAKGRYSDAKPTQVVVTGRDPYVRAQLWWRLDPPIDDPQEASALIAGMAAGLGGDSTVANPGRLMRLAGSVAWPIKKGRTVRELTQIIPLKEPGLASYSPEHLERVFPPCSPHGENSPKNSSFFHEAGDAAIVRETTGLGFAGRVADGRDFYMRDTVLAVLGELLSKLGRDPTDQELFDAAAPQYAAGADLTRPGRTTDPRLLMAKCRYALKRFKAGKIRTMKTIEEAKSRHPDSFPDAPVDRSKPLILTSAEFLAGYTPPAYLVDGIIQRGYLYSLTARTGHGKTAVAMYIAQCIARGVAMHGCEVKSGTVLILAGENPDDVRARFIVLGKAYGFDPEQAKIRWIAGVKHLPTYMPLIKAETDLIEDLLLIIVDTSAAYFPGKETNSNSEQGAYARLLRDLTFLRGKPAVLALSHPIKNALRDNLLPMGGSAFLNEVDGNLTLWANSAKQMSLHWLGKFRGPEFNPISFEVTTETSERVKDEEGRLLPSVVARPVSDADVATAEQLAEKDEDRLLLLIQNNKKASFSDLGMLMEVPKWKIQDIVTRLVRDKLLEKHRKRYKLTPKGKEAIGIRVGDEKDFG